MSEKKEYHPLLDAENVTVILNKIAIFGGLSEKQISSILKLLKRQIYKEGEYIFERGEEPTHIYIVESGKVKLIEETREGPFELIEFDVGRMFGLLILNIAREACRKLHQTDEILLHYAAKE